MKRIVLTLLILSIAAAHGTVRQEPQVIGNVVGGVAAVRLAVPEFAVERGDTKAAALAQIFNQVLWDDLDFAGPFLLANRALYPSGRFANPADIKTEDWTMPGIEAKFIAFGTLRVDGNDLRVDAQLHDVPGKVGISGTRYLFREVSERAARDAAHRFADEIMTLLVDQNGGIAQTEIAYVCDRAGNGIKEICVMAYDGHNAAPITAIGSLALTPSWSPDNKKIAFLSYREGMGIEVVGRADLRRFPFQRPSGLSMTPSWSPKDGKIAFAASGRDIRSGTHIMVADEDGKNIRQLTTSDRTEVSPVWNPRTGDEIVFASDRSPGREGALQLYSMDKEGANVRLLGKEGGAAYNPAWSPDGQMIAFAWQQSGAGKNRDIWLYVIKSGAMIQLTRDQGYNERPTWAPGGRQLAFSSNRSGSWQIYSMLADGRKPRVLTRGGSNEGPAWSGYMK